MGKKTEKEMKDVRCNKCKKDFISGRADNSRIRCPFCGSNESLSIIYSTPKPIQEYLNEINAQRQTNTAT